ncbi:MAG: hypothetical protein K2G04_02245, partial [Oscillospiraceae bacterium]|nr:hypothetical protein [Oscillospiraceae bacterium]
EITVQSITEPMTTVQTVGNVPEVTKNTVGTVLVTGTEDWVVPVETEPDDPGAGLETEAYTGVTLPDGVDDDIPSSVIVDLFRKELPESWTDYEAGESTYVECNECYKKLLVEKLYEGREEFCEFFGGAYWGDGWLFLILTDVSKQDEIFSDCFDGLESVEILSCKYSYSDLYDVYYIVMKNEKVNSYWINIENNCVEVGGELADEDKKNILADLEAAGYGSDVVEFFFMEDIAVIANPC